MQQLKDSDDALSTGCSLWQLPKPSVQKIAILVVPLNSLCKVYNRYLCMPRLLTCKWMKRTFVVVNVTRDPAYSRWSNVSLNWDQSKEGIVKVCIFVELMPSVRCQKVQLIFTFFPTDPCIFYLAQHFGQRLQDIFRQYVNLINHNTIQWYSRWNSSKCMLSKEKNKRNWSMLMSS